MTEKEAKETMYYKGDVDFTKEEIKTLTYNEYTINSDNKSIATKVLDKGKRIIHKQMLYTMKDDISYEVRIVGVKLRGEKLKHNQFKDLSLFRSVEAAIKSEKDDLIESITNSRNSASYLLESVEDRKEYKVKDVTFVFSHEDTDYGVLSYKAKDSYGECKVYFDNGGAYGFTAPIEKEMLEKLYNIVVDKNTRNFKREVGNLLEIGK